VKKKLNQQLQQEKRNQTTPHSTITITKEDDFVSYYLKIDDLFSSFFLDEGKNRKSLTYTVFCTFV